MPYYRISLLRSTTFGLGRTGAESEDIYIQIGDQGPKIVLHTPQTRTPLNSKIELITEEQYRNALRSMDIDPGH
jgi:hypothetical protein